MEQEHIISILAYDRPGVAMRITSLFSRRGFNINTISVGKAKDKELARFTISTVGDDRILEQIERQVYKLIDTIEVTVIHPKYRVERQISLIKLKVEKKDRTEILQLVEVFEGKIVDANPEGFIVEIVGPEAKTDVFISLLEKDSIIEIARTGPVAMNRWQGDYVK